MPEPDGQEGKEAEAQAEEPEPPDYGSAFAKLRALGLPDVSNAEYVSTGNGPSLNPQLGLAGGGWLEKEEAPNGSRLLWVPLSGSFPVMLSEAFTERLNRLKEEFGEESQAVRDFAEDGYSSIRMVESIEPADLSADLQRILDKLADPDDYSASYLAPNLLAFAALADSAGKKTEANKIAAKILTRSESPDAILITRPPEAVLKSLMASLGGNEMAQIIESFHESEDYEKLGKEMEACAAKFDGAWIDTVGIKQAVEKIKAYASGKPPIEPENPDSLSAEGKAFLEKLPDFGVKEARSLSEHSSSFWILEDFGDEDETSPVSSLLKLGPEAIPVLASIMNSEAPLPLIESHNLYGGRDFYGFDSESPDAEDLNDEQIQELADRYLPATVGSLSRKLLHAILPSGSDTGLLGLGVPAEQEGAPELKEQSEQLYKKIANLSRVPLAVYFLENDSGGTQRSSALQFLLANGGEDEFTLIENELLEFEQIYETVEQAALYVQKRQGAAQGFLDRYIAKAKEVQKASGEEDSGELDLYFNQLRELVLARGAPELLEEITSGKKTYQDVQGALSLALAKMKKRDAETLLLETASKSTSADAASLFVALFAQLDRIRLQVQANLPDAPTQEEPEQEPNLESHSDQWTALLERTEQVDTALGDPFAYQLNEIVAYHIELTFGEPGGLPQEVQRNFPAYRHVVLQRARERLAGTDKDKLSAIETPEPLTEEAGQSLLDALTAIASDSAKFAGAYADLTPEQRVYLSDRSRADLEASGTEGFPAELRKALVGQAHRLAKDAVPDVIKERIPPLKALVASENLGVALAEPSLLDTFVEALKKHFEETKEPVAIQISRQANYAGIGIGAAIPSDAAIQNLRQQLSWQAGLEGDIDDRSYVAVMLYGVQNAVAVWPIGEAANAGDVEDDGSAAKAETEKEQEAADDDEGEEDDMLEEEETSFGSGLDDMAHYHTALKEAIKDVFVEGKGSGLRLTFNFTVIPGTPREEPENAAEPEEIDHE